LDDRAMALWHGSYGETVEGRPKPELVAPSAWVVAPLLPGTAKAREARRLFGRRAAAGGEDPRVEARIRALDLVTPDYQIVDGTSVAASIVAGVAAGMLEANPALGPAGLRAALLAACRTVPGAPLERQGAGALDAGEAVALARRGWSGDI
jgi:serine protease AprX